MGLRQLVVDAWSWLNYKPVMADAGRPGSRAFPELAKTWVPPHELRRLAAYKVLASYDSNQAGQLSAAAGDEAAVEQRELGDAANLVGTALGYLLGSDQQVAVAGAEHADEESPEPGATEAAAIQERLRKWAERELLTLRIQQAERNAVLLGDSVYLLAWSPEKQRPTLRVEDPGLARRPDGTELNRLDLMIDFVPVVRITNTIPAGGEYRGRSALARVLQALDELAATDADSSAASATTGTPIIGLAGARLPVDRATGRPEKLKVEAGAVWQLGDSGRMDALDTSPQPAELRAGVRRWSSSSR